MSVERRGIFLFLIILMSALGLVASDICLPALPEMAIYFDCTQTEIQMSFSVFLLTLGICQLIYGTLADKFGRKKILVIGFSLFSVASLLCAFSTTLSEFIFCRALQAVGASVGSVLSRAIVADRFNRLEAVKVYTTTYPIVGLSPAIAPFVGGYLTYFFDWRATFCFMALFGILAVMLVMIFLVDKSKPLPDILLDVKETAAGANFSRELDSFNSSPKTFLENCTEIFRNMEFLGYAFIVCAGYAVFRCYTTESPFVFNKQGFVAEEIGYFYITLSMAYVCGNLAAKKLVTKLSIDKVLSIGMFFFVFGGLCLLTMALLYPENPLAIIIPMSFVVIGNGFLFPVGSAAAMSSVPMNFSGTASGLLGALQLILAALCVNWIGEMCGGQAFPMALYLISIIMFGLFSYLVVVLGSKIRYGLTR